MTDNERAVIEAAVDWGHMREIFGDRSTSIVRAAKELANAINELHGEHDGKWEPSDEALDQPAWRPIAEAPRDVPLLVFWPDFAQFGFSIQITSIPADINFNEGSGDVRVPTHFMPLPTPPEGE